MAQLSIKVDTRDFKKLIKKFPSQVRFVTNTAINKTLLDIQKAQRANLVKKFTIRRRGFSRASVKIIQFSKKQTLLGRLQIISPGSQPNIFAQHEFGTIKQGRESRRIAIPQEILPNKMRVLTAKKRPAGLGKKAFTITTRSGQDLLLLRKGKGKRSKTIVAFSLENRVVIQPRLGFFKLSGGIMRSKWQSNYANAWRRAIATRRL